MDEAAEHSHHRANGSPSYSPRTANLGVASESEDHFPDMMAENRLTTAVNWVDITPRTHASLKCDEPLLEGT